jgi:hypothetical protein
MIAFGCAVNRPSRVEFWHFYLFPVNISYGVFCRAVLLPLASHYRLHLVDWGVARVVVLMVAGLHVLEGFHGDRWLFTEIQRSRSFWRFYRFFL